MNVPSVLRDERIAAIHEFADWLAAHPQLPVPTLSLHRHLHDQDGTEAENLAAVRSLAASMGVDADELLSDRTVLRLRANKHVWYEVFAWHKGGRDSLGELDRLRAENERLRAALPADTPGSTHMVTADPTWLECKRPYGGIKPGESTTDDPAHVTCPECLAAMKAAS